MHLKTPTIPSTSLENQNDETTRLEKQSRQQNERDSRKFEDDLKKQDKGKEDLTATTKSNEDLESIFQNEKTDDDSNNILRDALKRSEILRNDLRKIGLLPPTSSDMQMGEGLNPEAINGIKTDGNGRLTDILSQSHQYDSSLNKYDMSNQGSENDIIRSQVPFEAGKDEYEDDERDWIVNELALAGTGSQIPKDDFVWSDTDDDLMMSYATKRPTSPPTLEYAAEAAMRDNVLSYQNDENIMMMTPNSYTSTSSPYKTTPAQGVDFQEPDYLVPEFGTDSSGGFVNENGVSGDYGDVGDEIDFEVINQVKKSKVARPTDSVEKKRLRTTQKHTTLRGKAH